MRENPVISDWVPYSGGCTEGLLGGWLAQRQAALSGVVAAGALSTFTLGRPCVPVFFRAPPVPDTKYFLERCAHWPLGEQDEGHAKVLVRSP
jgi:hypothetical protein